jgi:signal transduction histidine kinase
MGERLGQHRLERLLDISRELTSTTSLDPLLHKIVQAAAELTESEVASILLRIEEDSDTLRFVAASQLVDRLANIPVPIDGSIAGAVFTSGQPLIVQDVREDSRYYRVVEDLVDVEGRSLLAVPLQFKDRRIGALEAENKLDGEFGPTDVEIMTVLAAQATVAIENARLLEAVKRARDVLEQRVAERTAELLAANAVLQQRNEELDAFGHTVAHDLRGPIGNMTSYAELALDQIVELSRQEKDDCLRSIIHSGRKAASIINELLLLAGLRSAVPTMGPMDMASIVGEAVNRVEYEAKKWNATIVLPDTWPVAIGHGPWVEEVWVNYLSNGVKYGGRPPRLDLGADVEPDGCVRFWVRDNGHGLTPEEQSRLFTPFTRLDQVSLKGHGLGLSIVRRIVEKLGGEVGVESQVGRGSVFSFVLPSGKQVD